MHAEAAETEGKWADQAKRIVRTGMVRWGFGYEGLVALGVRDTPANMLICSPSLDHRRVEFPACFHDDGLGVGKRQ